MDYEKYRELLEKVEKPEDMSAGNSRPKSPIRIKPTFGCASASRIHTK